jgi:hypothetical protein
MNAAAAWHSAVYEGVVTHAAGGGVGHRPLHGGSAAHGCRAMARAQWR